MSISSTISKWGNSKAIRLPLEILEQANISVNDKMYLNVDENERIILTKIPSPKKGTLEYLFMDYTGGTFQTELNNLNEPVGKEQW